LLSGLMVGGSRSGWASKYQRSIAWALVPGGVALVFFVGLKLDDNKSENIMAASQQASANSPAPPPPVDAGLERPTRELVQEPSSFTAGLGISSVVYAERFNKLAKELHTRMRLQLKEGKVMKEAKGLSIRMSVDALTSVFIAYGADRTKLSNVTLLRDLRGDTTQGIDSITSMTLTTMAAFENPLQVGVPDLTMKLCASAMKKEGTTFKEKVQDKEIACTMIRDVIILSVS